VKETRKETFLDFDFSPETGKRTNIGMLGPGSPVNLERALKAGDRFGGHIMSGHVEGKGTVERIARLAESWNFAFSVSADIRKYIISKGSVGIDGISLTVADCTKDSFSVAIIPFTMQNTNLRYRKKGDLVNIEPDLLAKYVENALQANYSERITEGFLKRNGFAEERK
jgi:riboflavin synthase